MTVAREELERYVVYAERLSEDLEVTIHDLEFQAAGGHFHVVVDFSEVHSFLIPDQLDDSWLWPGLDDSMKGVVEHSALSEVMTGPPKPILLQPYLLELQTFVSNLRLGLFNDAMRKLPAALQTLDELTQKPNAQLLLALATGVQGERRSLSESELEMAVAFFEQNARDLVGIVRGELLEPLERTRAFLHASPFTALDAVTPVQLSGREPEVAARFQRLRRLRNFEKDGASYIDALAIEYVRRANVSLMDKGANSRVVLVSRSQKLHDLVREERQEGLWPEAPHGHLRHPRAFAPLAWQVRRQAVDAIPQLTATRASLDLCRRSAAIRMKSMWSTLQRSKADVALIDMVEDIKGRIISLVQMGGGVNESRVVASGRQLDENQVLQLLAMLLDRQEVFRAVAARMHDINLQLDREHITVGVLLHTQDAVAKELAVMQSSRTERIVLPRLGRLPYGLKFHTQTFLGWLDELQRRGEIGPSDLRDLFVRAATEKGDSYETLLFMGYVLAIVGQYTLADEYCTRALQEAEQHQRADRTEARFFHALCGRVVARDPERLTTAIRSLGELQKLHPTDPRFVAEVGNILLSWSIKARSERSRKWRATAPPISDSVNVLERAEALCQDDLRLRATVQNSLCFAYSLAYQESRDADARQRGEATLGRLIATLRALDEDVSGWPLRIKDTIVEAILLLNPGAFDRSFIESVVSSLENDLKTEAVRLGDRKHLQHRLRKFRQQLSAISQV